MAKKPAAPPPTDDDLGAGIEEELLKLQEQPEPENKFGIVVEDYDAARDTGPSATSELPPDENHIPGPGEEGYVPPPLSESARKQLDAEMAAGKAALAKVQADLKAVKKDKKDKD